MTKLALLALVFINAAFATQVFLGNTNKMNTAVFSQLKEVEQSSFGKNLLDTIALQIQNQAPLADVASLLVDLKSDLQHQQHEDDELHNAREAECAADIAEYDRRLGAASFEIQDSTQRIESLHNKIGELELQIQGHHDLIELTTNQKNEAIAARVKAAAQFVSRTAQHQGVLEALDLILEKLTSFGQESAPEETTLLQLAKIGKSNPIAAFVQVAASLDPAAWENLHSKIQALRDATQESLNEDAAQENNEINLHNAYIEGLNTLLETTRAALDRDEQDLAEQRADLAEQETRLETAKTEFTNATEGKAAKERQCEEWRQQYAADTEHRTAEVHIIEQVQEIFAQRLDTAKDYLRQRIEQ